MAPKFTIMYKEKIVPGNSYCCD